MIRQRILLRDWDWGVTVCYETGPADAGRILLDLDRLGAGVAEMRRAERNLLEGAPNTGLTFTASALRESLTVIGKTTSAAQFQDTLDHEKGHLAVHIGKALGLDPYGEDIQYLSGEIGRRMFPVARRFLCDTCRGKSTRTI